jgi:hypothetical protein
MITAHGKDFAVLAVHAVLSILVGVESSKSPVFAD